MAFKNFWNNLISMPVVRAEEEEEADLVDPQTTLRVSVRNIQCEISIEIKNSTT